jgi:hypothetical protein
MSNLSRIPKELNSYIISIHNPEEQQTAIETFTKLLPTLQRKLLANSDNLLIAAGLYEVRAKHGYKSEVYQTMLEGIATLDEAWADKHYRSEWLEAYNGYMCLPGSEDDKACILKMNPSRSALAAVRRIPDRMVYKFFMEVKKNDIFPTAAAVEKFAKQGRLSSVSSSTTKTEQKAAAQSEADQTSTTEAETEPSIIDVEAAPVVGKEIPTAQELEQLESANVETSADEGETEPPTDDGKFPNISEPTTTTTTEEPTLTEELEVLYAAYEQLLQSRYREIQATPTALACAQRITNLNADWLKLQPQERRR